MALREEAQRLREEREQVMTITCASMFIIISVIIISSSSSSSCCIVKIVITINVTMNIIIYRYSHYLFRWPGSSRRQRA